MRQKKGVDYNQMLAGTGKLSESMDYAELKMTNPKQLKKNSDQYGGMNQQGEQLWRNNLTNIKEIKDKCEGIFQALKCHSSGHLFLQPLDANHPRMLEVAKDFINLHSIEQNYRVGKYTTTYTLGMDIRKMFQMAFKLYKDDSFKYQQTKDIQLYFE